MLEQQAAVRYVTIGPAGVQFPLQLQGLLVQQRSTRQRRGVETGKYEDELTIHAPSLCLVRADADVPANDVEGA